MARDKKTTRIVFNPPLNCPDLQEVAIQRWPEKGLTEVHLRSAGGQAWFAFANKWKKPKGVYEVNVHAPDDAEDWTPPIPVSTGEEVAS